MTLHFYKEKNVWYFSFYILNISNSLRMYRTLVSFFFLILTSAIMCHYYLYFKRYCDNSCTRQADRVARV